MFLLLNYSKRGDNSKKILNFKELVSILIQNIQEKNKEIKNGNEKKQKIKEKDSTKRKRNSHAI